MDTITLQEALAGFTANESAALGSYIGLSSGGAGQKQSIAALAKVAGGLLDDGSNITDLDDFKDMGVRGVATKPSGKPSSEGTGRGIAFNILAKNGNGLQFYAQNKLSVRLLWDGTFYGWHELLSSII